MAVQSEFINMRFPKRSNIVVTLFVLFLLLSGLYLVTGYLSDKDQTELRLINIYPHDREAFTQGLIYEDGVIYESTGLYGRSSLRKVDPKTGRILKILEIPRSYFAEGITIIGDRIYQLTWKSGTGFIYDKDSFSKLGTFSYKTEGWGLTTDGTYLVISDGSSKLYFMDRENFSIVRTVNVTYRNKPVSNINELEYVKGLIYANIWQSNYIIVINPENGRVKHLIDLEEILGEQFIRDSVKVPNGIAFSEDKGTFFVTGKLWTRLFELGYK